MTVISFIISLVLVLNIITLVYVFFMLILRNHNRNLCWLLLITISTFILLTKIPSIIIFFDLIDVLKIKLRYLHICILFLTYTHIPLKKI